MTTATFRNIALTITCPACDQPAGEACRHGGRVGNYPPHTGRIQKAWKEAEGPRRLDVIYIGDQKFRFYESSAEALLLRRGNSKPTWHTISPRELEFDPWPGMWRIRPAETVTPESYDSGGTPAAGLVQGSLL